MFGINTLNPNRLLTFGLKPKSYSEIAQSMRTRAKPRNDKPSSVSLHLYLNYKINGNEYKESKS